MMDGMDRMMRCWAWLCPVIVAARCLSLFPILFYKK
jgi:hypothetical protein